MKTAPLAVQMKSVLLRKSRVHIKSGSAMLKEPGVMNVEVLDVPSGVTVINLNKIGELSGIKGQFRSRCDYLVLFESFGRDMAVFVELKKTIDQGTKGLEQLRRSRPYLAYLRSLCKIEFDSEARNQRIVSIRYVLIGSRVTQLLPKQRISDALSLPDKSHHGIVVRRIVGEKMRFDRLVSVSP